MPCPALEGFFRVLLHVAHFWPWRERSRHSGDWMGLVGGGGDSNLKVCFSYFLFRACSCSYSGVEQSNSKDMICSVVDVMEKYSAKFYTFFFLAVSESPLTSSSASSMVSSFPDRSLSCHFGHMLHNCSS